MKLKIYTDGACIGNPGPGGWAAIIIANKQVKELFGGEKSTTNNRMELTAAIEALKYCEEKNISFNEEEADHLDDHTIWKLILLASRETIKDLE